MTKFTVKEDIVHDVGTICRDDEEIVSIIYIGRAKKICDLLNEFCEENQRLKRQICNLEHTRDFCAECCERLEKENEQLKSEIREVRGEYEQLWMRL